MILQQCLIFYAIVIYGGCCVFSFPAPQLWQNILSGALADDPARQPVSEPTTTTEVAGDVVVVTVPVPLGDTIRNQESENISKTIELTSQAIQQLLQVYRQAFLGRVGEISPGIRSVLNPFVARGSLDPVFMQEILRDHNNSCAGCGMNNRNGMTPRSGQGMVRNMDETNQQNNLGQRLVERVSVSKS